MTEDPMISLLQKVALQDRAAFREVYRIGAPKLTGVLTRILRDRTEVEDALQEVFIRVWKRAAQFDPSRGTAVGWLVAIARHVALDRIRARPESRGVTFAGPRSDTEDDNPIDRVPSPQGDGETHMLVQARARRVVDCFRELDGDRAAAVQGAYLQGLSYQQLADRYDVPLNTMRTWLRRSLSRLKECLDR